MAMPQLPDQARQLDQLALLYAMADHIQRARHVDDIYEEAVEGLRRVVGADRSALLVTDARGRLRFKAWTGLSASYRSAAEGHSPWGGDLRNLSPVLVEDVKGSRALGELRETVLSEGMRAIAFIPLLHRGRVLGAFVLGHDRPHSYEVGEIRLAEAIAGHLAFAIWRSRTDADQAELLRRFEAERSVLESVVKQMPAGVLLADVPSGRIIMTNQQVSAAWRRPFHQAAQVSDYALWEGLDPDGLPLPARDWPLARSVLRGETVRAEEIEIVRGDGTRGFVRMSSSPVTDSQGRQLAAVATVYDVTEEKQEGEDRAFLEAATAALNASLDLEETLRSLAALVVGRHADWCIVYRARETGDIDRVASAHSDPACAEELDRLIAEAPPATVDAPVAWVMRERKPLLTPEVTNEALDLIYAPGDPLLELTRRFGTRSFLVLPLMSRDRALGALTLVRSQGRYNGRDLDLMTELARRAGTAMDNALLYGKARAADQAKSNFLAVMSHEFRTPLSAILGYADILTAQVHGGLNEKQRSHLDRVKASVRHLSHLVDEILSFASMEAGRQKLSRDRFELISLARDVSGIMEPIAEATGLELRVCVPDERIELETDESKVRQILINLVSNAIKYTPEGHVELTIRIDGGRVCCIVEDTGSGIPPQHLEDVFEPFWQVERGDGRRITGTGLGLAVARRLARLMGGEVSVRSEVGRGSVFTLELPLTGEGGVATAPLR